MAVHRGELQKPFFEHVQCLIAGARDDAERKEQLVLVNTRLVALCANHDSISADTAALDAAAEVYRDLLGSVRGCCWGAAAAGTAAAVLQGHGCRGAAAGARRSLARGAARAAVWLVLRGRRAWLEPERPAPHRPPARPPARPPTRPPAPPPPPRPAPRRSRA